MKTAQPNTLRAIVGLAAVVAYFVIATGTSQAQPQVSANDLATLTPLNPAAIPKTGTFWLLQGPNSGHPSPPLPCPPGDLPGLPIYQTGNGQFVVDDSQVDYDAIRAQQAMVAQVATTDGPQPQTPQPTTPQPGDQIDYVWFQLTGPTNPQITAYTADYGGGWLWGIASITNLADYDPREYSWTLMDPKYYTYDMDGGIYTYDMPPFDKPMEFYKAFDTDDYFSGYWTPIKYLGCNLANGESVTTNDVVMKFDLKGDIYRLLKDPELAVQAVVVRPSGETLGCIFDIASNGIATVTAPATAFATGLNTVYITFVNEGPQYVDVLPSQPPDDGVLDSMTLADGSPDVAQQEAYLLSLGIDPPGTGETTNNYPHAFTGYLQFNAAPPIEDTIGSPYITANWGGATLSRVYRCQEQENITVILRTPDGQLIGQTNGLTQPDGSGAYTFEADITIPDDVLANLDTIIADVQADTASGNGGVIANAASPTRIVVPYIIDQTRFRGMYNTAAWCSFNYDQPSPGLNPYKLFWYGIDGYMDGFMSHAANAVLVDIGMLFQFGFCPAIPDPYVLDNKLAYKFTGTPAHFAHFSDVLTNSLYMGINFISHTTGGVSLFDDNLNLQELSAAAGNRPGYFNPGGSHGGALTNYFSYKRRMDVWMEGACSGGWRTSAALFGTPQEIDQTTTPIKPTVAFGYDEKFRVVSCSPHFEALGSTFYGLPLGSGNLMTAKQSLDWANSYHPEAYSSKPAIQGHPNKTCTPNRG